MIAKLGHVADLRIGTLVPKAPALIGGVVAWATVAATGLASGGVAANRL